MKNKKVDIDKLLERLTEYCEGKGYYYKLTEKTNSQRLDISNLSESTIVIIYNSTGSVQIQGKQNDLRSEISSLMDSSSSIIEENSIDSEPFTMKYHILLPETRQNIKHSLSTLKDVAEISEKTESHIEYMAKIKRDGTKVTLTQFGSGILLLQGKKDKVSQDLCDHIEMVANPEQIDVISRFAPYDKDSSKCFSDETLFQERMDLAEKNVMEKLGCAYDYLEPYNQKWFMASEFFCISKFPLPELSPIIMPASKAFEGFAKKILVDIGLVDPDHFKTKKGNFSILRDPKNGKKKAICEKGKYVDSMLRRLDLCLEIYRHFMMHSDDDKITKIGSQEEAEKMLHRMYDDTKDIFEYLDGIFNLKAN